MVARGLAFAFALLALPALAGAQGFVPSRNIVPGSTRVTGATDCAVYADASGIARCSSSEAGYDDSGDIWIVANLRLRDSSGVNTFTMTGGNHAADRTVTWTVEASAIDVDFGAQGARLTIGSGAGFAIRNGSAGTFLLLMQAATHLALPSNMPIKHSSTSEAASGSYDTSLAREAAGVYAVRNGSTGDGWLQNRAGRKRVTSTVTNTGTTFSNVADLTFNVTAGRHYSFEGAFLAANSVAAEGAKFDLEGGTATATDIRFNCQLFDSALLLSAGYAALATDINVATMTGDSKLICHGTITVNAGGTLIPRFAKNSTGGGGTLSLYRGSYMLLEDMP